MATYHRNIAVGLTMLVALALLGVMIMLFGDAPVSLFRNKQMRITFAADSAEGISKGSPVYFRGVNVGKVDTVDLAEDRGVIIRASLDARRNIPANVEGFIRGNLIGGSSTLHLEARGRRSEEPLIDGATVTAHLGGSAALPQEFTDLAKEIQVLVAQINQSKMVDRVNVAVDKAGAAIESANRTINKVGDAVDELKKLIGDDKLRGDIRQTIANFRSASENAKTIARNLETFSGKLNKLGGDAERIMTQVSATVDKAGVRIDDVAKSLAQRMDQVATVLDRMDSIANKIDKGEGTAGKLINDAKLYEALTDSAAELHLTIKDLRRLVQQWEQEGVPFKLGK